MSSSRPSFKKDYYAILGLETPTWRTSTVLDPFDLKTAYRRALLAAHPDKASIRRQQRQREGKGGLIYPTAALDARFGSAQARKKENEDSNGYTYGDYGCGNGYGYDSGTNYGSTLGQREEYTVDDVKEAYQLLSRRHIREEYDKWLAATYEAGVLRYGDGERGLAEAFSSSSSSTSQARTQGQDGVGIGMESLDLSDFEVVSCAPSTISVATPTPVASSASSSSGVVLDEEEGEQEWRRECRCGHTTGFKITEASLVQAEERGEKEVLVGCEGCSLWVRVSFDVEEEGG